MNFRKWKTSLRTGMRMLLGIKLDYQERMRLAEKLKRRELKRFLKLKRNLDKVRRKFARGFGRGFQGGINDHRCEEGTRIGMIRVTEEAFLDLLYPLANTPHYCVEDIGYEMGRMSWVLILTGADLEIKREGEEMYEYVVEIEESKGKIRLVDPFRTNIGAISGGKR